MLSGGAAATSEVADDHLFEAQRADRSAALALTSACAKLRPTTVIESPAVGCPFPGLANDADGASNENARARVASTPPSVSADGTATAEPAGASTHAAVVALVHDVVAHLRHN